MSDPRGAALLGAYSGDSRSAAPFDGAATGHSQEAGTHGGAAVAIGTWVGPFAGAAPGTQPSGRPSAMEAEARYSSTFVWHHPNGCGAAHATAARRAAQWSVVRR